MDDGGNVIVSKIDKVTGKVEGKYFSLSCRITCRSVKFRCGRSHFATEQI